MFVDWPIASTWTEPLQPYWNQVAAERLHDRIVTERKQHEVYPPIGETFSAFALTPIESVKAVILGQDPYHGPGQAHGLSFSVRHPTPQPPSLKNIFRELHDDLQITRPNHGDLTCWATQGVLLLNTTLTVRRGEAHSHQKIGWEPFTDYVIQTLAARSQPIVFVLWGTAAQKKADLITVRHHEIIASPHPSPLSSYRGFFGSRPFSRINESLQRANILPIDWRLPDIPMPADNVH